MTKVKGHLQLSAGFALITTFVFGILAMAGQDASLTAYRVQQEAVHAAEHAESRGKFSEAEEHYLSAVKLAAALPPGAYHVQTDTMRALANLYGREQKVDKMESTLQERLRILENKQTNIDLDVGVALLDLQGFYGGTNQDEKSLHFANRAMEFYTHCQSVQRWRANCDTMLAEAEGMLGELYFKRKLYDRAEPWLIKVVGRPDDGVRPEMLIGCISAYAAILNERGNFGADRALSQRAERLKNKAPSTVK